MLSFCLSNQYSCYFTVKLTVYACIRSYTVVFYLQFERISVIRAGDKVCVDASSATELSLVGAVLLQPQTVPLTRTIGLAGHTTCTHKHNITQYDYATYAQQMW